jgi:hypothetical protein
MTLTRYIALSGLSLALLVGSTPASARQAPAPAPPPPAPAAQAAPAAALPSSDEILKRYRDALGGEAAIRKHTARRFKGTFEIPAQGMKGDLEVTAMAPDLMTVVVTLPGLGELRRGYDGKVAWSIDPAIGPRLLEGREADEFKHSADFYDDLHEPSKFTSITVVGKVPFEGQEAYEVKLVRGSGFEYTEYFSVDTGLIIGGKLKASSQMGEVPVTTSSGEYKAFDGVLVPTVTKQRMMGLEQVVTVTSVSFEPVDAAEFALPPAIAALVGQQK